MVIKMNCKNFEEKYLQFLYGEVDEKEGAHYKEHMDICEKCREIYEDAKKIKLFYTGMEEIEPPEYLVKKVKEYALESTVSSPVRKEENGWIQSVWNIFLNPGMKWALAGVVIIILIIAAPLVYRQYINTPGETEEIVITEIYNDDEVDMAIESLEYNLTNTSGSFSSNTFETGEDDWDVSYMDQKLSDIEAEIKTLKKDFYKF